MSLTFKYGTMESSKSLLLISQAYNFKQKGKSVIAIKPSLDTRSANIYSRAGLHMIADIVLRPDDNIKLDVIPDLILCDECNFLSANQVDQLRHLALSTHVVCYGLKTDSTLHLFPGSKRLLELADVIEEIKMSCSECSNKSSVNARFRLDSDNNKIIIVDGPQIMVGGCDSYFPLCFSCWSKNKIV
ncbi:MAG: thymidine kinase [Promethearchaeota archaeon]|jgi:thymidine kinase